MAFGDPPPLTRHVDGETVDQTFVNSMLTEVEGYVGNVTHNGLRPMISTSQSMTSVVMADIYGKNTIFNVIPAAGTTFVVRFASATIQPISVGASGTIVNQGLGNVQVTADASGVSLFPAGDRVLAPKESLDWSCVYYQNSIRLVGGSPAVSPTPTTKTTIVSFPVISFNSGTYTFSLDSAGVWNLPGGSYTAPNTIQWQRDGSNISGQTAAAYVGSSGADAGHAIRAMVTALGSNGVVSDPAPSNAITPSVTGQPTFATGYPKIVMAEDHGTINGVSYAVGAVPTAGVEIGWKVKIDFGTIGGSPAPTTKNAEWFNRGADASILSRGTDSLPGPWEYTTVSGDSGSAGNETIFSTVSLANGVGSTVTKDTPDVAVLPVGTLTTTPGDPGSTPPPPNGSGRDATLQPFAVGSPINLAIGSGAVYADPNTDSQTQTMRSGGKYINSGAYSMPYLVAKITDPICTFTSKDWATQTFRCPLDSNGNIPIAAGTDANFCCIDYTNQWVYEFWQVSKTGANQFYAQAGGFNNITELAWGCGPLNNTYHPTGLTASQFSQLAGLIRSWEVNQGSINHALAMSIQPSKMAIGPIFPATRDDGNAASAYTGIVHMGTMFAIPPSVNIDSLVSTTGGRILGHALQDYGAYIRDTGSQTVFYAEPALEGSTVLSQMRNDVATLVNNMVRITNQGPNAIGGGGTTRRQPNRAAIGSAGTATAPAVDPDHTIASFESTDPFASAGTYGHTVASGSNKLYLAIIKSTSNAQTNATPTFGGQALTLLDTSFSPAGSTQRRIEVWYLKSPAAGNQNLAYSMSLQQGLQIEQISFSDVNQTTPFGTVVKDNGATKTSLSVTTAAGLATDTVVASFLARATDAVPPGMTVGSGQTKIVEAKTGTNVLGATTYKAGSTSSVTQTADFTEATGGGDHAAAIAFRIIRA